MTMTSRLASTVSCNEQTALDIEAARRNARIDVAAVRAFVHGGESGWEAHKKVEKILSSEPVFDKSQRFYTTRKQAYVKALAMQKRVEELRAAHGWDAKDLSFVQLALDEMMPIQLHTIAFEPVILSQGSPEFVAKYGPLAQQRGIIGCYLQTELGHGSNVAQLETTATYLPSSEEFEIHSPTLTSTKWWIGALGKTSTHGVVQARLLLPDGKDYGPHLFLVQLRSMEDHKVLPGIRIGDIGPKAMSGYAGIDNGFARFDHVRVPRAQMLSKFAQVMKDGSYVKPPHAKLSYGGMLYIRSGMILGAGRALARASTISIRYATVRRQGGQGVDGSERQVISYPSVYIRLLPILARAYAYIFVGRNMILSFQDVLQQLARGDTSILGDVHAILSGLKSLVTSTTSVDIETARRSMGGHGYSAYAGLGRLYADYLPAATFEGDNFVLDQQVVRAALKALEASRNKTTVTDHIPSPFNAYLRRLQTRGVENPSWSDWRVSVALLELRAARMVEDRFEAEKTGNVDASFNQRISRAVTEAYVAAQIGEMIETLPFGGYSAATMQSLQRLNLLTMVESALGDILTYEIIPTKINGEKPVNILRLHIDGLCKELLPEAISLSDAFGFTDWELDSALGVHDGRVYEALWNKAQTEPLNGSEVPEGYEEFIKPLIEHGRKVLFGDNPKSKL